MLWSIMFPALALPFPEQYVGEVSPTFAYIYDNLFIISSFFFTILSHHSATWSWNFSSTIFASSYVTINFGTSLCTFIFFLYPPSCDRGLFYGRVSIFVEFVCISIYVMYPPMSEPLSPFCAFVSFILWLLYFVGGFRANFILCKWLWNVFLLYWFSYYYTSYTILCALCNFPGVCCRNLSFLSCAFFYWLFPFMSLLWCHFYFPIIWIVLHGPLKLLSSDKVPYVQLFLL